MKPIRVAEALGVSPAAVTRWRRAWRKGGEKALAAKPHPGGKPRLTAAQLRRQRIGLYFRMHEKNITAEQAEVCLREVRRRQRGPVILVLDRRAVHRQAAKALFGDRRFWIEWLPPYAPDLNQVEHVWDHTKCDDLADYVPDDVLDLEIEAELSLDDLRTKPDLPRSCFHGAKLGL
jgi:transposase-like protein